MKKIEKLNVSFEKEVKPVRHQFEALHDKINECVRALNLMDGHLEPWDILGSAGKPRRNKLDSLKEKLKEKQRSTGKILDAYHDSILTVSKCSNQK